MRKADLNPRTIDCRCHGFSLVELMVALVITLILLAGIGQVYLSSKKSFTIQDTLGHQQENARYAVEVVAQDARRTSYWGGNADIGLITGTAGIVADNGTCSTSDNSWGRMLDRAIYGKNNTNAGYACIPNSKYLGSDVLVIRYQAPWQIGSLTTPNYCDNQPASSFCPDGESPKPPAVCNRLYLRSSLTATGEALGRVFKGQDACNASNDMDLDASTPPDPSERVAELVAHAYYVGPSGSTCNGKTVPSLFRETLDDNGLPDAEEIATGVEKFEVEYGVDNDGDRSVDEYVAADAVTDWGEVIAIRYWLLTRAECPETGYTNDTVYDVPDVASPFNDGYRRQVYTTTVMLRNR
jgi:type IV pilus assembly protein PilW